MIDPCDEMSPFQLPVLDVSQPLNSSSSSLLEAACKEWGFFQIINHGISKDLYTKIHHLSSKIFSLHLESKLKLGPSSSAKTYTPHFIASPFFESLRVSGPDFATSAQHSVDALADNQSFTEFSRVVHEYCTKMMELAQSVLKVVLMALGEGFVTKFYDTEFKKCHGYLRINNYSGKQDATEVEGLGMHTDMSCLTIVYQDEAGGLQVRSKDGKWLDIVQSEETLVVNIGDMLQAWSNGRLRSSDHRVMLRKPRDRISLSFFWCFEDEKVIAAPDEVVGEEGTRAYRPFLCSDYLKFRESNEEGKFEKVGFTVKDFADIR